MITLKSYLKMKKMKGGNGEPGDENPIPPGSPENTPRCESLDAKNLRGVNQGSKEEHASLARNPDRYTGKSHKYRS
jgi:hypothetical protein